VIPAVLRLEISNNRGIHNRGTLSEFQDADRSLYASKGGSLSAIYDVEKKKKKRIEEERRYSDL
jgi:hypothetical protein